MRSCNEAGNKLNALVANAFRVWSETGGQTYRRKDGQPFEKPGAGQLIFSDLGTISVEASRGFSACRWIRNELVRLGVPASEIAYMQDSRNPRRSSACLTISMPAKCASLSARPTRWAPVSMSRLRPKALHHLDVPWLPSQIEQREGRIVRQGNQHNEVDIFALCDAAPSTPPCGRTTSARPASSPPRSLAISASGVSKTSARVRRTSSRIASIGGFDLAFDGQRLGRDGYHYTTSLRPTGAEFEIELPVTVTSLGAIARLEHALSNFDGERDAYRHRLADARKRLATYGARAGEAFPFEAELGLKRTELAALEAERAATSEGERKGSRRSRPHRGVIEGGREPPRRAVGAAPLLAGSCGAPPALRAGGGLRKEDDEGPPRRRAIFPPWSIAMKLRFVDPRALKENPDKARHSKSNPQADALLLATIKAVGIVQPPVVTPESDGGNGYVIDAGHRRIKQAIAADLEEIAVLVVDRAEDGGAMRSLAETLAHEPLNPVDQWRAIERLVALGWTEEATGVALAQPVRQIRKLRLLANVLPAMLDQKGQGRYAR